ncbi:MAG: hypothetical protein WDN44_10190 [Sphingomonas sp.]
MDFRNIDWFSTKPSKERIIVGVAVIALLGGGYALGRMGSETGASMPIRAASATTAGFAGAQLQPASMTQPGQPALAGPGPVPLVALDSGNCRTFAPEGWRITDQNKDGTVLSVASPDGRLMASYGGAAFSSGHVAGFYGDQFRSPEAVAHYLLAGLTHEEVQMDPAAETVGVYQAVKFTSATHSGYVLIYRFPVAADPGGFGVILRIAIGAAGDPRSVGVAGAAAAATRCTSTLHPSDGPVYHAPRDGPDHGAGSTGAGSDADMAGTYNAQLGTGWVHDDAGNNYNVDVTNDWHSDGPAGEGFYKRNGNDLIKLTPGLE